MYLYRQAIEAARAVCQSLLIPMEWLPIAIFIFLGIVLIVAEVIFVPGTTVVGVLGFLCMGYGVYQTYVVYDKTTGTLVLIGSLVAATAFLVWSFRNRSWERFSLKSTMEGKVNDENRLVLKVGDKGTAISSLRPIGKAEFEGHEIEVRSNGGYVNENVEIEVLRIEDGKVFVKPV